MRIILPTLKWDKANDGIDVRGFSQWMTDYELAQLPPDTVFPRPGQIWEAVRDCEVHFEACIEWQGPLFSKMQVQDGDPVTLHGSAQPTHPFPFGTTHLQKGERVCVVERSDLAGLGGAKPIGVNLEPLRYQELECRIVPDELRAMPGYKGYRLFVRTARPQLCIQAEKTYLNEDFRLIEDAV